MKILAPDRAHPDELSRLRDAGHEIVIEGARSAGACLHGSRPEGGSTRRRRESRLALETSAAACSSAPRLRLVIVPFIGTDKIDLARTRSASRGQQPTRRTSSRARRRWASCSCCSSASRQRGQLCRGEWAQPGPRRLSLRQDVGLSASAAWSHVARRLVTGVRLLASIPIFPCRAEALTSASSISHAHRRSDIVSLHASLTDETRIIGEAAPAMKPPRCSSTRRARDGDEEASRGPRRRWIAGRRGRVRQGAAAAVTRCGAWILSASSSLRTM